MYHNYDATHRYGKCAVCGGRFVRQAPRQRRCHTCRLKVQKPKKRGCIVKARIKSLWT